MAVATMLREVGRLKEHLRHRALTAGASPLLARLKADPARVLTEAGISPDPWQARVLRACSPRTLLCCSRQSGKSVTAGAVALHTALTRPGALVLVLSASERQAKEFLAVNVVSLWRSLGRPVPGEDTATSLRLVNGSRVLALPENERTVRVFSGVALLVIDEAARVSDGLYYSVRPMLAVSGGRLVALSTPFGKRGWYYAEWSGVEPWQRVRIPATLCPRLSREFLAAERKALGPRWYRQEYECSFEAATGSPFDPEAIGRILDGSVKPLSLN